MGAEFQIFAVKEFIVNVWEVRKQNNDSCPNQLHHLRVWGVPLGLRGKGMVSSGKVSCIVFVMHVEYLLLRVMCVDACACTCGCKCKCDNVHSCMDTCTCVCSSAHSCGCVPMAGMLWRLIINTLMQA